METLNKNEAKDRDRGESIKRALGAAFSRLGLFYLNLRRHRKSLSKRWSEAFHWFDVHHMGLLLIVLAAIVILGGALIQYRGAISIRQLAIDLWSNFGTELISIATTVLIIDALNRRREKKAEERQEKNRLFRELKSKLPDVVERAIEEMRDHGWIRDGTLAGSRLVNVNFSGALLSWADFEGSQLTEANLRNADLRWVILKRANLARADLQGANLLDAHLEEADLVGAKLQGANLHMANLLGADIRHANLEGANLFQANFQAANMVETNLTRTGVNEGQLLYACSLKEAIMTDGSLYDGRLNLEGDIEWAQLNGLTPDNLEEMAQWYLVSTKQYLEGQEWYRQNYERLLRGWDYIVQHHGPKKELEGYCSPSLAEREIIERTQSEGEKRELRVREIDISDNAPVPPRIDLNTVV